MKPMLCLPLLILAMTPKVHAQGMDTQLATTFHEMATTTNPQFESSGRPVASLGSFSYRTPVTRPQLLSFDPPRFSGGCGGIDLYGGSFSFIGKEELQGLMRQIAANAKSYAFNLALGAVCNKCLQEMQALQDKVQKINQMMKSSCDMAQALVNTAMDPATAQMSQRFRDGALAARQGGTVSDLWASMNQGWGKDSPESALATDDPDEFARIEPGNIVWRLLKRHGVGQWFSGADDALLIDLQSFLGTVIVCAPGDGGICAGDATTPEDRPNEVRHRKLPAVLDVQELVHGSNGTGGVRERIVCGDVDRCLDARIESLGELRTGLKKRILDALVGDPATGMPGYVQRYRKAQGQPTAEDLALRSHAPSQFGILHAAIDHGEESASVVADVLAESIAVELVSGVLASSLAVLRRGAAGVGPAESAKLFELIDDAGHRLRRSRVEIDARLAQRARVLEGLGLTLELGTTPDLRSGPVAAPGY